MSRRPVFRVLPSPPGWLIRTPAGGTVTRRTKAEAVTQARGMARNLWVVDGTVTQLVVHNRDGRIAFEATYGRDPERRRG